MKYNLMVRMIVSLVFIFSVYLTSASDFERANRLYNADSFAEAIEIYESIVDSGFESAEIYYNLGNAYYKSHNLPKAILNYERARLLNPHDEDIQYNLELTNTMIVDKIEKIRPVFYITWFINVYRFFSPELWAIISGVAFVLSFLAILIYIFSGNIFVKRIMFYSGVFLVLISIFTFLFSYKHMQFIQQYNSAIVMSPTVSIKSTPNENGTDLFILHEGTRVKIEESLGEWVEIKIDDGNKGWMKANDIEII
ncbi:tetratricopeptide repeat protein [Bacteroidota bacterium]